MQSTWRNVPIRPSHSPKPASIRSLGTSTNAPESRASNSSKPSRSASALCVCRRSWTSAASDRTVAATRMSERVSAGTVVVGDMPANGPCKWTTDQTARIEAANNVTPAPAVPNLTAAQRRNGSCSANGACVDTARSGGSSMSAPPKPEDPITMRPAPTAPASATRVHDTARTQRGSPIATPTTAGTIVSCASTLLKNRWFQTVQYGSPRNHVTAAASRTPEIRVAAVRRTEERRRAAAAYRSAAARRSAAR